MFKFNDEEADVKNSNNTTLDHNNNAYKSTNDNRSVQKNK